MKVPKNFGNAINENEEPKVGLPQSIIVLTKDKNTHLRLQ